MGKLPPAQQPEIEKELEESNQMVADLQAKVEELQRDKAGLETQVGQLTAQKQAAAAPAPVSQPSQGRIESTSSKGSAMSFAETSASPRTHDASVVRRLEGDVVESPELIHAAYEVHFTGDLYRIVLRPNRTGVPCSNGRIVIRGLARVDPNPPPTSYSMVWDDRLAGFVVYIGQARPPASMSEPQG